MVAVATILAFHAHPDDEVLLGREWFVDPDASEDMQYMFD
jgi:hypothetical protein